MEPSSFEQTDTSLDVLDAIQRRVLWLATSIIHHANRVRTTSSGVKVGGHQASSASVVSILTALYFGHLRPEDRVSIKPHASPVLHAINYLIDRLDVEYLTELRAFHGLQSYPSRIKDPDQVDFSTGSVGIGATATVWSAMAHRYVSGRFPVTPAGRHIALLGDAELDEGAIWEAIVDPMTSQFPEVMWIVDVNRQSLDRVVPDIEIDRLRKMFEVAGWNCICLKYGQQLRSLFEMPGGSALQNRIDTMSNEEYQRLLRTPAPELRSRLVGQGKGRRGVETLLKTLDDDALYGLIRDLGGHDLGDLLKAFQAADADKNCPTVIFAYTLKGWKLPVEGHPANHSALLTVPQWESIAEDLGASASEPWKRFEVGSPEAQMCSETGQRLKRAELVPSPPPAVPAEFNHEHAGRISTQQAFGRFFGAIGREAPEVATRIVTVSPDVASSTNLGGWINSVGIWHPRERKNWFEDDNQTLMSWREGGTGQHIELGIAEGNLVGLLGELGATWSRDGEALLPVGTIYDPFVNRALEPWTFGIYSGGQSILVGTPSGITLAPEGGAHQSIITPSIGLEHPGCVAWEPAFAQDFEWTMLAALGQLGRPDGTAAYFRLTTRPIDQTICSLPDRGHDREERRIDVLQGGYLIRRASQTPQVVIVGVGAIMPEVIVAAEELELMGIEADVVCLTSADLIFRAFQAKRGLSDERCDILDRLFPSERAAPIVSVLDGHPHTLSFLGAIREDKITCLGVTDFGQVGDLGDLYAHFGIDTDTIVGASLDLVV